MEKKKRGRPKKVQTPLPVEVSSPTVISEQPAILPVLYRAILQANNTQYFGEGTTVFEALSKIPLHPMELHTVGNVIVSYRTKSAELFLSLPKLRLLLGGEIRRQGFAYQFESLLK